MKALLLTAMIAVVALTGCGDSEAFLKGDVAKLECEGMLIKPENLVPGSKGEVRYKIQVQNCTKGVTHSYQNQAIWAEAKVKYNIK
jgi:uncharacterized lipoprotein YehR (DUF1307 family)